MEIGDGQIEERAWPRVALVLGEEQFHRSAFHSYKGGHSRGKSVERCLAKTKPPVPGNGGFGILNTQYGDHLFFHLIEYSYRNRLPFSSLRFDSQSAELR